MEFVKQEPTTSPSRSRFKKSNSQRSEFPDSGPEMALLRTSSLIDELLLANDHRAELERELDWLEKTHPTPVASGLCNAVFSSNQAISRLASVLMKNFVSRCGCWTSVDESLRTNTISMLMNQLEGINPARSENIARVLAAICDADGVSNTRQQIIGAFCEEASRGMPGASIVLRLLSPSTVSEFRNDIVASLCRGLFTISSTNVSDSRFVSALCEVVLCENSKEASSKTGNNLYYSEETKSMMRASCTFSAQFCPLAELRARSVECFSHCWSCSSVGDRGLMARVALERLQVEEDEIVVAHLLDFWVQVVKDPAVEAFLETVMSTLLELMRKFWFSSHSESQLRALLIMLVSSRPECADILAFALESCVDIEEPRDRYVALTALGALCHSEWLSLNDGPIYVRLLCTSAMNMDDSSVHRAAMWALEQSCLKSSEIFFAPPADFGRLMQSLIHLFACSDLDVLASASRCLSHVLEFDKEALSGRLAYPHRYNGELGRIPGMDAKTNRFSPYFSQLVEALGNCDAMSEATEACALLIQTCANDVLGFVSWMLNRQIRALWCRLGAGNGGGAGQPNGRKRIWASESTKSSTTPQSSNDQWYLPTKSSSNSSASASCVRNAVSIRAGCLRIKACIERLSRMEKEEDPTVWKVSGDAASVLIRTLQVEPREHYTEILECLREICRTRGDVNLSAIIQSEFQAEEQESERVIAVLGVAFTMAEDISLFHLLEQTLLNKLQPNAVRLAALRAMGEYIHERDKRLKESNNDALIASLCRCLMETLQWPEQTLVTLEDPDEIEFLWSALDVACDCFSLGFQACRSQQAADHLAKYAANFIARKVSLACRFLKYEGKETSVALKSLDIIVRAAQTVSRSAIEEVFEQKYDEFGPVFDTVAAALAGKGAGGEVAQKAGKIASDALYLVFPKGNFA